MKDDRTVVHKGTLEKSALDDAFDARTVVRTPAPQASPQTSQQSPPQLASIAKPVEEKEVVHAEKKSRSSSRKKKPGRLSRNEWLLSCSIAFVVLAMIVISQRWHFSKVDQAIYEQTGAAELSSEGPGPTTAHVGTVPQTEDILRLFDLSFFRTRAQVRADSATDSSKN